MSDLRWGLFPGFVDCCAEFWFIAGALLQTVSKVIEFAALHGDRFYPMLDTSFVHRREGIFSDNYCMFVMTYLVGWSWYDGNARYGCIGLQATGRSIDWNICIGSLFDRSYLAFMQFPWTGPNQRAACNVACLCLSIRDEVIATMC